MNQSVTGTPSTTATAPALNGTWTVTGSLITARVANTATLLPNGKVLVAGGYNESHGVYLASAELYDPTSGTWTAIGRLGSAREGHTATLLPNGKVLISGGYGSAGSGASAELYDPASGTWSETGRLTKERSGHTATLLADGKVLVAGGVVDNDDFQVLASAELYDPASGSWSGAGHLTAGRRLHTATLLPSGKVLVAGGDNFGPLASAELYDPATGTWTATGGLITERYSHTAMLLPNGQVLVAGGFSIDGPLASAELYDPATGTWTVTGSLGIARFVHTATLLPNGQVLVAAGLNDNSVAFASAGLYDPARGTWTATGSLRTARWGHTETLLPNGKVLVAGGVNNSFRALPSAELYDSVTGALELTSGGSRLTHGTAGTFDVNLPLTGGGIECRYGPSRQEIVFTFNNNVTGANSVTTSCGTVAQASVDPNDAHSLLVKLGALSCDEQLVTVTLNGVHDDQGNTLTSASVTFGLLFGDVNGDGIVNNADVVSIRAVQSQKVNSSNFRNDLTLDGRINNKDIGIYETFHGDSL